MAKPTFKETRVVNDVLDMNLLKFRIETDGLKLLVSGLKDRKILGRRCHKCGTVYSPGPTYCRKCFIDIEEVAEVSDRGKITTFTVGLTDIRGNPLEEINIPVGVTLDGSESLFLGSLTGWNDGSKDAWKKVKIGLPVKIIWREETTGALADIVGFELIK